MKLDSPLMCIHKISNVYPLCVYTLDPVGLRKTFSIIKYSFSRVM